MKVLILINSKTVFLDKDFVNFWKWNFRTYVCKELFRIRTEDKPERNHPTLLPTSLTNRKRHCPSHSWWLKFVENSVYVNKNLLNKNREVDVSLKLLKVDTCSAPSIYPFRFLLIVISSGSLRILGLLFFMFMSFMLFFMFMSFLIICHLTPFNVLLRYPRHSRDSYLSGEKLHLL